jgi:HD-GYP domain-containing protein (c-di-GMP phosphodiesterase class II)
MSLQAVAIGVDPIAFRLLREILPSVQFTQLPMDITKLLKTESDRAPDLIFCGRLHVDVDLVDVAQLVRSIYANPPMYYVCSEREGFDRTTLERNRFTDAFLLPMDKGILEGLVPNPREEYKDVPLTEISPDTVLEFDTYIYLPVNRKHIRFTKAGRSLEGSRAKRLFERDIQTVYIEKTQLPAFYRFTARQTNKVTDEEVRIPGGRQQQRIRAIRTLLSGILTENAELPDYAEIVNTYILDDSSQGETPYEKMLKFTSSAGDTYSHVSNISSLATLLAIGLNIGKPDEIALAGLLHDIGLADVPAEIQIKDPAKQTDVERRTFEQHPAFASKIIKKRGMDLSTMVLKIIEQHHERWDAKGYPNELKGDSILPESQLVAIADEFEYLTQMTPGKVAMAPRDAMNHILKSTAYNPELLSKIRCLLDI